MTAPQHSQNLVNCFQRPVGPETHKARQIHDALGRDNMNELPRHFRLYQQTATVTATHHLCYTLQPDPWCIT